VNCKGIGEGIAELETYERRHAPISTTSSSKEREKDIRLPAQEAIHTVDFYEVNSP